VSIDVHSHYSPESFRRALAAACERDLGLARRVHVVARGRAEELADVERRLADMDATGVEVSVLSVPPPGVQFGPEFDVAELAAEINDELIAVAEATPGRFLVLLVLPMPDVDACVAELDRLAGHPLVRGIELLCDEHAWALDEDRFEPVYERAAQLGLPVLLHPALGEAHCLYDDWNLASSLAAPMSTSLAAVRLMLSGTLDRVPGLVPIVPHLGGTLPYLVQRLDDQSASPQVSCSIGTYLRTRLYYDTCSFHQPALVCARDTVGAERLLLGSDYPFRGPVQRSVEDIRSSPLTPDEQRMVLDDNARRWFAADHSTATTSAKDR
jgi:predicted TIM-barrel fold metal-dependent hydrolase